MSSEKVCHQCGEDLAPDRDYPKFMNASVCCGCGGVLEDVYSYSRVKLFTEEEAQQIRMCAEENYRKYKGSIKPQEQSITTREWAEKVFGIPVR